MTTAISSTLNDNKIIESIEAKLASLRQPMKRLYDRSIVRDLSSHNTENLLRRNTITTLNNIYDEALLAIEKWNRENNQETTPVELTKSIIGALNVYNGMIEELLQYAISKHRSSCALSNFPDEHNPSREYVDKLIEEATLGWEIFSRRVKEIVMVSAP